MGKIQTMQPSKCPAVLFEYLPRIIHSAAGTKIAFLVAILIINRLIDFHS